MHSCIVGHQLFLCLEVYAFLEHVVTHYYSILVQIPESQASMLFKQNPWQQKEKGKRKKIKRAYFSKDQQRLQVER